MAEAIHGVDRYFILVIFVGGKFVERLACRNYLSHCSIYTFISCTWSLSGYGMKILAQHKKALFEYTVLDTLEAGMVLNGDEVKSIRAGHASLIGSFAHIKDGELYLVNASVTAYKQAYIKREDLVARS